MSYRGYNDRSAAQFDGEKILFWRDESRDKLADDLPIFGGWLKGKGDDPKDFIRQDIPYDDRKDVIAALQIQSTMNPRGGNYGISYLGYANCRICKKQLGSRDMFGYGFIWPEKAEHYLDTHNVWTPGCDRLLVAIRKAQASGT